MFSEINERIEVICRFEQGKAVPLNFFWHAREITIKKINLSYTKWDGRTKFYYFAVSEGADYFKLQFDSNNLSWTLIETYTE